MRTSTAVFLVLFLFLASSAEQRAKVASAARHVRDAVAEATDGFDGCDRGRRGALADANTPEVAALRARLGEMHERENAAELALRTIDRSMRAVEDRIRAVRSQIDDDSEFEEMYEGSLDLLVEQKDDLERERDEVAALAVRVKGEMITLQTQIDLEAIRIERARTEALLGGLRGEEGDSPVERLARR